MDKEKIDSNKVYIKCKKWFIQNMITGKPICSLNSNEIYLLDWNKIYFFEKNKNHNNLEFKFQHWGKLIGKAKINIFDSNNMIIEYSAPLNLYHQGSVKMGKMTDLNNTHNLKRFSKRISQDDIDLMIKKGKREKMIFQIMYFIWQILIIIIACYGLFVIVGI